MLMQQAASHDWLFIVVRRIAVAIAIMIIGARSGGLVKLLLRRCHPHGPVPMHNQLR
jgi:hypothetical protein